MRNALRTKHQSSVRYRNTKGANTPPSQITTRCMEITIYWSKATGGYSEVDNVGPLFKERLEEAAQLRHNRRTRENRRRAGLRLLLKIPFHYRRGDAGEHACTECVASYLQRPPQSPQSTQIPGRRRLNAHAPSGQSVSVVSLSGAHWSASGRTCVFEKLLRCQQQMHKYGRLPVNFTAAISARPFKARG